MRTLTLLTTILLLFVTQQTAFSQNSDTCTTTYSTISPTSCGTYVSPGYEFYDSSGTYYDTIPNTAGCDSIITINLTIADTLRKTIDYTTCSPYTVPSRDETYETSGTYKDTVTSFQGCPKILTINLTIRDTLRSTIEPTVHCGDSYTVPSGDETYTTSGTYYDTVSTRRGCERIFTIDLTVSDAIRSYTREYTSCEAYTVPSGDETYTSSGTYFDTLSTSNGCDSIITIDLTVDNTIEEEIYVETCSSYTAPSGDETYSEPGVYYDTVPGPGICDTLYKIRLKGDPVHSYINKVTCNSYTVPSGDETYETSGTYHDTISAQGSCDSIFTINLSVRDTLYSTIFESVSCGSYTVPSGDETYTTSGTYYDTLSTVNGCDSIIAIHLNADSAYRSRIQVTTCSSYTVPSGNATYETSGIYYDTLTSVQGCDSIIEIYLNTNALNTSITRNGDSLTADYSGAGSYQWLRCENGYSAISGATGRTFSPDSSGYYAVAISDSGCVDTSYCRNFTVAGITHDDPGHSFNAYPNPTQGEVTIELGQTYESVRVAVRTNTGRRVSVKNVENTDQLSVNIEGPAGYYFVTIITKSGRHETLTVVKK